MCLRLCVRPVNMPGPIRKRFWLRPVMPITASVQPESGRTVYTGSDFLHPIRFRSCKASPDHIAQNRSGSDPGDLVKFWPNGSGPEASRCAKIIGPGSAAARHQFPTFRLGCILSQTPRIVILYKTSLGNSLVDCIRFWPSGHGPETSRCARTMGPASDQCS